MRRHRIRRKGRLGPKEAEGVLAAVLGVALALWCITALNARLSPALSTLAKAKVERAVTEAVALRLREAIEEQTGPLVTLERDENGRAAALKADTAALNRVREQLLRGLGDDVEKLSREKVGIPVGSLTPWRVCNGLGPEIKVGIYAAPTVAAELSSHFSQAGLNQTRHVMELAVTVRLELLLPSGTQSVEVKTVTPVTETVIVGTTPEEYLQMNGT